MTAFNVTYMPMEHAAAIAGKALGEQARRLQQQQLDIRREENAWDLMMDLERLSQGGRRLKLYEDRQAFDELMEQQKVENVAKMAADFIQDVNEMAQTGMIQPHIAQQLKQQAAYAMDQTTINQLMRELRQRTTPSRGSSGSQAAGPKAVRDLIDKQIRALDDRWKAMYPDEAVAMWSENRDEFEAAKAQYLRRRAELEAMRDSVDLEIASLLTGQQASGLEDFFPDLHPQRSESGMMGPGGADSATDRFSRGARPEDLEVRMDQPYTQQVKPTPAPPEAEPGPPPEAEPGPPLARSGVPPYAAPGWSFMGRKPASTRKIAPGRGDAGGRASGAGRLPAAVADKLPDPPQPGTNINSHEYLADLRQIISYLLSQNPDLRENPAELRARAKRLAEAKGWSFLE